MFKNKVTNEMFNVFPDFSNALTGNQEIVFQYLDKFRRYRNKKLLIVGGGPTTNLCEWENLDYDYIWSCNHFYLNPKFQKQRVDLTFAGQEVDLSDEKFRRYIIVNDTLLGLELAGKFYNRKMDSTFDVKDGFWIHDRSVMRDLNITNHFCCFTRYYGWIGANWRQMILALFLGFKEIYFVGMDGYSFKKDVKTIQHSFEKDKIPMGGPTKPGAEEAFKQHLIIFWNYVLNRLKPDVRFFNLGEFTDENMTSHISKIHFPLTEKIKESIGVKY